MQSEEQTIIKRIWRRLKSARGSAYAEFAFVAPLVLALMCFAVDFMRILYCEQQIEIASRALCDIESHLKPGKRLNRGAPAYPGRPAKIIIRNYLAESLAKEGLPGADRVYLRADVYKQTGAIHKIVNGIFDGIEDLKKSESTFLSLLGKFLSFAIELITMRTERYLSEVIGTDRVVKTSVSVYINTYIPKDVYAWFGGGRGWTMIPQYAPRLGGGSAAYARDLQMDRRVRYYCHLPSLDTATVAPPTYIRKLSKLLKSWVKLED